MIRICFGFVAVCITILNANGFHYINEAIVQKAGWEYMARGHLANFLIFYGGLILKSRLSKIQYVLLLSGITACTVMMFNVFGYWGQQSLQVIILCSAGYASFDFYKTIPRYSYQLKVIFAFQACYHIGAAILHICLLIFFPPVAHTNTLQPFLKIYISKGWIIPSIILGIWCIWRVFNLTKKKAEETFNPDEDYIIHFLPMKDGVITWVAFLFSIVPIPHYAIWDGSEQILYKFSKQENGLVAYKKIKLNWLFKNGLVLICEPVYLKNRLAPLVGKVKYTWYKDNCWKMVKYAKGEIDTWERDTYLENI